MYTHIKRMFLDFLVIFLLLCESLEGIPTYPMIFGGSLFTTISVRQSVNVCLGHVFGEFVAYPLDCKMFYLCMEDGEAVLASCPSKMLFNSKTNLCDSAENVVCSSSTSTTMATSSSTSSIPTQTDKTTMPTPTSTPSSNGNVDQIWDHQQAKLFCSSLRINNKLYYIGSSINCKGYYLCYYSNAIYQECGDNLHWNGRTAKCEIPKAANCSLPNNYSWSTSITAPNSGDKNENLQAFPPGLPSSSNPDNFNDLIRCPKFGSHLFPHMERCDYFIYCAKGNALLQRCPFYHYFDVKSKKCKRKTEALCVKELENDFRFRMKSRSKEVLQKF